MVPRSPSTSLWKSLPSPVVLEQQVRAWKCGGLRVISAIDLMKSPVNKDEDTPTWHVSVSRVGEAVSDADLALVRKSFGMKDAEEDNHEPGRARHLFLTVDPAHRADCECNVTEETFVEPNGHRWKSPPSQADDRREQMASMWGAALPVTPRP